MEHRKKITSSRWKTLLPVMNDHIAWFNQFISFIFYPEFKEDKIALEKPTSFAAWYVEAAENPDIRGEVIEKLNALHKDMMVHANEIVREVGQTKQKPSQDKFKNFLTYYEEFIGHIRRLEHDFMLEDNGYDLLTGLRNPKLLVEDIERELGRLARQGRIFTIAMARVDYYNQIVQHYSKDECEGFIKLISELIKLSVRSFDDAYYLGEDKFVLVLKQSEVKGGISALERLRRELERQKISYNFSTYTREMSMSCCIAEPTESDNVEDLINNLKADLDNIKDKAADTVLEYFEMSPLQRFMRDTTSRAKT